MEVVLLQEEQMAAVAAAVAALVALEITMQDLELQAHLEVQAFNFPQHLEILLLYLQVLIKDLVEQGPQVLQHQMVLIPQEISGLLPVVEEELGDMLDHKLVELVAVLLDHMLVLVMVHLIIQQEHLQE
jgi:hypothetical protein